MHIAASSEKRSRAGPFICIKIVYSKSLLAAKGSMLAREKAHIIKDGKIASLNYSRYWARKQGARASGRHGNMIVAGGSKSLEELIASTRKGVVVTRTGYAG
jgi:hypothetical protein